MNCVSSILIIFIKASTFVIMFSPAILNLSDLDESFKSPASLLIPMTELHDNELHVPSSHPTSWKKRMCVSILLLILGGFLATLVYLCVKVE